MEKVMAMHRENYERMQRMEVSQNKYSASTKRDHRDENVRFISVSPSWHESPGFKEHPSSTVTKLRFQTSQSGRCWRMYAEHDYAEFNVGPGLGPLNERHDIHATIRCGYAEHDACSPLIAYCGYDGRIASQARFTSFQRQGTLPRL